MRGQAHYRNKYYERLMANNIVEYCRKHDHLRNQIRYRNNMEYILNSAAYIFTGVIDLNKRIVTTFVTRPATVLHHILLCCDIVCSVGCYGILYDTMLNCTVQLKHNTDCYSRICKWQMRRATLNTIQD